MLTNIRFADGSRISSPDDTPIEMMKSPPDGCVVLDYEESGDGEGTLLFLDEWLCIGPTERFVDGARIVSFEMLRSLPLYLLVLAPAQIRQARAYCVAHNPPEPKVIYEDVPPMSGHSFQRFTRPVSMSKRSSARPTV